MFAVIYAALSDMNWWWAAMCAAYVLWQLTRVGGEQRRREAADKLAAERRPVNAAGKPIKELIERLQALPAGTTYDEDEPEWFVGQTQIGSKWLGTGYQLRINIVEGLVCPHPPADGGECMDPTCPIHSREG